MMPSQKTMTRPFLFSFVFGYISFILYPLRGTPPFPANTFCLNCPITFPALNVFQKHHPSVQSASHKGTKFTTRRDY